MNETIEYGLFLVHRDRETLAFATESEDALLRVIGKLSVVQEHKVYTRTVTRGEWQR